MLLETFYTLSIESNIVELLLIQYDTKYEWNRLQFLRER
jgi:hypothetical protein